MLKIPPSKKNYEENIKPIFFLWLFLWSPAHYIITGTQIIEQTKIFLNLHALKTHLYVLYTGTCTAIPNKWTMANVIY